MQAGARLAQSAERKALNLVVVGSSPTVGVPFVVSRLACGRHRCPWLQVGVEAAGHLARSHFQQNPTVGVPLLGVSVPSDSFSKSGVSMVCAGFRSSNNIGFGRPIGFFFS